MGISNVFYTGVGLVGLAAGLMLHEYMPVAEQNYIGIYLDHVERLEPNTMDNARAYARDRNSLNGLVSVLMIAGGVCAAANGTIMVPEKREDSSRETEKPEL